MSGLEKVNQVLVWGGKQASQRPANYFSGKENRKSCGQGGRGSGFLPLLPSSFGLSGFREGNLGMSGEGGEAMFVPSAGYWLYPQSSLSPIFCEGRLCYIPGIFECLLCNRQILAISMYEVS